jgi:SAM-dependent methyltransferase
MTNNSTDTFERSCDHWSEARRDEMEGFYALASIDYRHLAKAIDWKSWLEAQQSAVNNRCLRLLDVACGSGKFPAALQSYANIKNAEIQLIDYSLLDPSSFSISEASKALAIPFKADIEYQMTLQDLKCNQGHFDILWATHALYAIPEKELKVALERFLYAMGFGLEKVGVGFIAHASSRSHYLQFFKHYLNGFKDDYGTPYSSSEQIIEALTEMDVPIKVTEINYINQAPRSQDAQVEKYLQRCLFDDTVSLSQMLSNPVTGPYLKKCRNDNYWQFKQSVSLIFLNTSSDLVS